MKLVVMNQWIPRAARADRTVLALQRLAEKETLSRPKPEADHPVKSLPKNFGDFIRLARLESPYRTLDDSPSSLLLGEICLVGGLAVASSNHPSYPWRRHVDILLIGGTLKKEDLHHQLNAAVLPALVFFSGGGEPSVEQIRKSSNATRIVDLGGAKDRFFEIEYDPADTSDTLALTEYRLGLLGKKRLNQERFLFAKYSRIHSFLRERYLQTVTQKLELHLARERGNTKRAWIAAENMAATVSEYLTLLDRPSSAPEKEKEEMLERVSENMHRKTLESIVGVGLDEAKDVGRRMIENNLGAFALYLEAWGLREAQDSPSSFGVYR